MKCYVSRENLTPLSFKTTIYREILQIGRPARFLKVKIEHTKRQILNFNFEVVNIDTSNCKYIAKSDYEWVINWFDYHLVKYCNTFDKWESQENLIKKLNKLVGGPENE